MTRKYSKIADEHESAATLNNTREVYQKKNILIGKSFKGSSQISDVNDVMGGILGMLLMAMSPKRP